MRSFLGTEVFSYIKRKYSHQSFYIHIFLLVVPEAHKSSRGHFMSLKLRFDVGKALRAGISLFMSSILNQAVLTINIIGKEMQ